MMKLNPKTLIFVVLGILLVSSIITYYQFKDQKQKANDAVSQRVNEQKFTTFKLGSFQVNYPYWPNTDPKLILDPKTTKVAVSDGGCNFAVAVSSDKVPTGKSESDFQMGATLAHVFSSRYQVKNQVISIIFVAEKTVFESACRPFIDKTVESVKIN